MKHETFAKRALNVLFYILLHLYNISTLKYV